MTKSILPGALALALAGCNLGDFMAGGERWDVVSINGEAVGDMSVIVNEGQIIGGYDGCTEWSFKTPESPVVVGDGEACPPDPARNAYWTVVNARRADGYWSRGEVLLDVNGHEMELKRQ